MASAISVRLYCMYSLECRSLHEDVGYQKFPLCLHFESIITQLSGSTGKTRYNGPRYIHPTVVQNL